MSRGDKNTFQNISAQDRETWIKTALRNCYY